jgi:hypothetical protein
MAGKPAMPPDLQIPDTLAARPWDERRRVPIPPVSVHDRDGDQIVDFTTVNGPTAVALASERRCSLCGEPMGYWVAFVGGPASHSQRRYLDPPGHPECMRAAIRLCPFIVLRRHRRAPGQRHPAPMAEPAGFAYNQPDTWTLGITRSFHIEIVDNIATYLPEQFKFSTTYGYDEAGHIREHS